MGISQILGSLNFGKLPYHCTAGSELHTPEVKGNTMSWTPNSIMAFWAIFRGFGPLFYLLWGFRVEHGIHSFFHEKCMSHHKASQSRTAGNVLEDFLPNTLRVASP